MLNSPDTKIGQLVRNKASISTKLNPPGVIDVTNTLNLRCKARRNYYDCYCLVTDNALTCFISEGCEYRRIKLIFGQVVSSP